jgi:folate-binding protein YgfZ
LELNPIFPNPCHSLKNLAGKPVSRRADNFCMNASATHLSTFSATATSTLQLPLIESLSCALPHLGVIRAQGEDAANFLHNQLTQDVLLLNDQQARLAAWCNAKGRMLASFMVCKPQADEVWLVCQRDVLPQTLKRLSMFVLRARVKLSDATDELQVHGLIGNALQALTDVQAPGRHIALDHGARLLTLYPAQGQARALWIAPKDVMGPSETVQTQGAQTDTVVHVDAAELWAYSDVMSGVAWVSGATAEAFVPQMLNYESVDGVNFKKGCYPGQEVVARSQFRGTLKRRAFIVSSSEAMHAGQEVFAATTSPAEEAQPCGLIAQAANAFGQHVAIAELQLAATESTLYVGSLNGPELRLWPLPYPLRDDI